MILAGDLILIHNWKGTQLSELSPAQLTSIAISSTASRKSRTLFRSLHASRADRSDHLRWWLRNAAFFVQSNVLLGLPVQRTSGWHEAIVPMLMSIWKACTYPASCRGFDSSWGLTDNQILFRPKVWKSFVCYVRMKRTELNNMTDEVRKSSFFADKEPLINLPLPDNVTRPP